MLMVNRFVDESTQIRICRILCIFFMMSVHVNPGLSNPSLVSTGSLALVGAVWGDFLGRASVAALSFISGYLLIRTASEKSLAVVARRRFQTLIVPMLTWNLIFCLLQVGKALLLHKPDESVLFQPGTDLVAALTGLTGPTANLSLFFLRDLFVSALLVQLLRPALAAWPLAVVAAAAVVAVFDLAAPLVFRPSILFFVAAGAAWAMRGETLAGWLTPRAVAVAVAVILAGVAGMALLVRMVPADAGLAPVVALQDLLRRALLVVLVLGVSAALTGTRAGGRLVPLERRIFETYLLHVPLIGMLWVPWTRLVGGPQDPSYLLFFLLAPVVAIAGGFALGALCDRLPPPLQTLLRGKVRPLPRVPVPAAGGAPVPAVTPRRRPRSPGSARPKSQGSP